MFYTTEKNDHGLPHDPFKAIVAPRPIGWITSIGADGAINLAPYSYFNGVDSRPPMVMFASEGRKGLLDTAAMKPIARGGYHDYSVLTESFTMRRPSSVDDPAAQPRTLERAKAGH